MRSPVGDALRPPLDERVIDLRPTTSLLSRAGKMGVPRGRCASDGPDDELESP